MTFIDVNPQRVRELSQEVAVKARDLGRRIDSFTQEIQALQWFDEKSRPQFNKRRDEWVDASSDTSAKLNDLANRVEQIGRRYTKLEGDLEGMWA